ncbi:MAG: hypothetical protein ACJA09_001391 [Alcanivorax sp.]|jgi:hypothetical protein
MITKQDLVGSWALESWSISYSDRQEVSAPYGENPQGLLLYSEEGWMSAAINREDRARFPDGVSPRAMPPEPLAEAYGSYFHYAGRYRVSGGDIIHTVAQSLNPNFPGSEQLRHAELNSHILVLRGEDQAGGTTRSHALAWRRLPAATDENVIEGR